MDPPPPGGGGTGEKTRNNVMVYDLTYGIGDVNSVNTDCERNEDQQQQPWAEIAPQVRTNTNFWIHLLKSFEGPCLIGGDFNGHHHVWGSPKNDSVGQKLVEAIGECNMVILNNGDATRIPRINEQKSAVDVTLVSAVFALKCNWQIIHDTLGSDHLPILIDLEQTWDITIHPKSKWNTKLAKWDLYRSISELLFSELLLHLKGLHREKPQYFYNNYHLSSKVITPQYTDNPQMNQLILHNTLDGFNGYTLLYTDGSKKQEGVGCTFLVPETNLTGSYKFPDIYSSFSAEAFAISMALDIVCTTKNKICILTDSLSVLKLLGSSLSPSDKIHPIVRQIKNKVQIEQSKGSRIVFIWAKAHSGLAHNEAVDSLAKAAVNSTDFSTDSLCVSDCINFVKKNTRDEWARSYQQYRTNTSTQYVTIQEDVPKRPWFYDLKISRRYVVMYTRLRFGHGRYPSFLAKIGILNTDNCETCNVPGTLDHIFFECSQYHLYQKQFLENLISDGLYPPFNVRHLMAMNAQNVIYRIVEYLRVAQIVI
nr:unnamed protein product [Callosobruchus analis]